MAYPNFIEQIIFSTAGRTFILASGTGEKGRWTPGRIPYIVRALAVAPLSTRAVTSTGKPIFSVRLASKVGQTSATGQHKFFLTLGATGSQKGRVTINASGSGVGFKVSPGQEVIVHQTRIATGTYTARCILYLEPSWEDVRANTNVTRVGS
jgi:hypothetical protein